MKYAVSLQEMVSALNNQQRGIFQSKDQVHEQLMRLVKMLPEWLEAKDVGHSGRFLKLVNPSLAAPKVYELIKQRAELP